MNPTREEMLNGLTYVQGMLLKMQDVLTQYLALERQFRAKQKGISTSGVKNKAKLLGITIGGTLAAFIVCLSLLTGYLWVIGVLAVAVGIIVLQRGKTSKLKKAAIAVVGLCLAATIFMLITGMDPVIGVAVLLLMAGVVGVEYAVITRKNRQVAAYNKKVDEDNAQVQEERTVIYNQYIALQQELSANSPQWFPPDYYNTGALEFFINAVRNSRADSVKEMVNLFEADNQHKEMIAYQQIQTQQLNQLIDGQQELIQGQKAMNRQLRFANMMNVANFIQLSGINSGVQNLNTQAGQINKGLRGIASDVGSIKNKIKDRR